MEISILGEEVAMEFLSFLALSYCLLVGLSDGCSDEDRKGLLDVRAAFDIPGHASRLDSWRSGDVSDCCSWERVRCGSKRIAGRVTGLHLGEARPVSDLTDTDSEQYRQFTLNATLFIPFQELRRLNLSKNFIVATAPHAGIDKLGELGKLEVLDLSGNSFDDSIILALARIATMKALYLNGNFIGSDLPVHEFGAWSNLSKLEYLDLSLNSLNETAIPSLVRISSLKTLLLDHNSIGGSLPLREFSKLNLEVLDLRENEFVGSIPALDEEWTSLQAISLSGNKLNGTLLVEGLCKIKNLQELDLSQNIISGVIPSCLGDLTSLRFFDVSENHLQVTFPSVLFSKLKMLEYISLTKNQFEGTFFLSSLYNHSNLKTLHIMDQNSTLEVETESQDLIPSFQLESIILSKCNLNTHSGALPSFLSTQFALQLIDLSHNRLIGPIPNWLLENKTNLHYLSLRNNSFSGPLILPSHHLHNMSWLDLSKNKLNGELPVNIGIIFPNLVYLKLTENSFHGAIPSSFGNMRQLQFLYISNNSLSGEISDKLLANWPSLIAMHLSYNKFHGIIPSSNLNSLIFLYLNGNQFSGGIPSLVCNYSVLTDLDFSDNELSGRIPNCLGELPELTSLNLKHNYFEGTIPYDLCNLMTMELLDLSNNNLTGKIPSFLNLSNLKYLHLQHNRLTGSFPISLCSSEEIITMDVSNNQLSAKLPRCPRGSFANLRVLVLRGNQLEGSIPKYICHLKNLHMLDMSRNRISGYIPSCLHDVGQGGNAGDSFEYHASYSGGEYSEIFPTYMGLLQEKKILNDFKVVSVDREEFTTKSMSYLYVGGNLKDMSGIDLSCNQLEGVIPLEMGNMSSLHALNLSNNHLTGPIPHTFSNLKGIESLDLSHNLLTGLIPRELVQLNYLEVFSVAYNNLSGPTLGREAQFSTFDEKSYQGNPNLCGPPLDKNCTSTPVALPSLLPDVDAKGDDGIDRSAFFVAFAVAFVIGFWGFMYVFYFKTNWYLILFHIADRCTRYSSP